MGRRRLQGPRAMDAPAPLASAGAGSRGGLELQRPACPFWEHAYAPRRAREVARTLARVGSLGAYAPGAGSAKRPVNWTLRVLRTSAWPRRAVRWKGRGAESALVFTCEAGARDGARERGSLGPGYLVTDDEGLRDGGRGSARGRAMWCRAWPCAASTARAARPLGLPDQRGKDLGTATRHRAPRHGAPLRRVWLVAHGTRTTARAPMRACHVSAVCGGRRVLVHAESRSSEDLALVRKGAPNAAVPFRREQRASRPQAAGRRPRRARRSGGPRRGSLMQVTRRAVIEQGQGDDSRSQGKETETGHRART